MLVSLDKLQNILVNNNKKGNEARQLGYWCCQFIHVCIHCIPLCSNLNILRMKPIFQVMKRECDGVHERRFFKLGLLSDFAARIMCP